MLVLAFEQLLILKKLVQGHSAKNLEIHEWQEVCLHVFVLGDLGVIVHRKFHVIEVASCNRRIVIHNVIANSVFGDITPGEPGTELPFPLFLLLCHHLVVN